MAATEIWHTTTRVHTPAAGVRGTRLAAIQRTTRTSILGSPLEVVVNGRLFINVFRISISSCSVADKVDFEASAAECRRLSAIDKECCQSLTKLDRMELQGRRQTKVGIHVKAVTPLLADTGIFATDLRVECSTDVDVEIPMHIGSTACTDDIVTVGFAQCRDIVVLIGNRIFVLALRVARIVIRGWWW